MLQKFEGYDLAESLYQYDKQTLLYPLLLVTKCCALVHYVKVLENEPFLLVHIYY